jgi:phytoene synthase
MDDAATKRETELADHYRHCEAALREQELDLWLASLFAPASARPHLHAIGAFAAEIASVRARVSQPILGEMRLRWWYDSLEAATDSEAARAHPIADALIDTLDRHAIAREEVVDLLEAHSFDLYDEPMESLEALETYCDRVFGAPMRWRAIAIDAQDVSRQEDALRDAGRRGSDSCPSMCWRAIAPTAISPRPRRLPRLQERWRSCAEKRAIISIKRAERCAATAPRAPLCCPPP